MVDVASFFSSGFAASLFVVVIPNNPLPPVAPKGELPVVGGTGADVPGVSGFLVPNRPPNVDVEVAVLSAGLGGSPKNPPVAGAVVVVDESPGGLGGPPNNPPPAVLVLGGPPSKLPEVAAGCGQHQRESEVRFRIYLVLEHLCSPRVLVLQKTFRRR